MKGTPTPIETQAFSHFSRVVCYAKGTTKIGSFLERKKAELKSFLLFYFSYKAFFFYFQEDVKSLRNPSVQQFPFRYSIDLSKRKTGS